MRTLSTLLFASFATAAFAAGPALPPAGAEAGRNAPRVLSGPAETTDWMNIVAAEEQARMFRKAGRAMIAIECRPNLALNVDSGEGTEFRFSSVANEAGIEWTWREFSSPELPTIDRKLAGEGFRLVARQEFERHPSGQKRSCALWQK